MFGVDPELFAVLSNEKSVAQLHFVSPFFLVLHFFQHLFLLLLQLVKRCNRWPIQIVFICRSQGFQPFFFPIFLLHSLWNIDCYVIQTENFCLIFEGQYLLVLFLYYKTGLFLAVMLLLTNLCLDFMPWVVLIEAWRRNFGRTVVLLISLSNLIVSVDGVFRESKVFF